MSKRRRNFSIMVAGVALCAMPLFARTVSITDTHYTGDLATSFDLAFGEGEAAEELYVAYGNADGGSDFYAWEHTVKLADIPAATTSYTASVPAGWGTSVNRLRFFMLRIGEPFYDYSVEYIQTTGQEYCNTGVIPTCDTTFAIDMAYLGTTFTGQSSWIGVFGERVSAQDMSGAYTLFINKQNQQLAMNFWGKDSGGFNTGITTGARFVASNENCRIYVDGVRKYNDNTRSGVVNHGRSMLLFAFRTPSGLENRNIRVKLYGMKISEGGTPVRDYIPVVKNGIAGLWDNVGKSFTPSATSSAFIAGSRVADAPANVESVASNGSTVYSSTRPVLDLGNIAASGNGTATVSYTLHSVGATASTADIYYRLGTASNALGAATVAASGVAAGSGAISLSGLPPETIHWIAAYATSADGDSPLSGPVPFMTPASGATSRTFAAVSTNRVNGLVSSLDLVFSAANETSILYMAYGAYDGGDDPEDWDNLEIICEVMPYAFSATAPVPAGWGATVHAVRYFIGYPPSKPYDRDVEWIASTGEQHIDTGSHIRYGQTFSITWRQYDKTDLSLQDKGWGAGSTTDYNITGGGRRASDQANATIRPYFMKENHEFSPLFYASALGTETVYRDVCVVGDRISYTMTDIASGDEWVVGDIVAPKDGASYDSGSDIYLFRDFSDQYAYNGKKAIYGATLSDTAASTNIFDLVPVVKNGQGCMYDMVSGALLENQGTGRLVVGPEVTVRLLPTSPTASIPALSLLDSAYVSFESVSIITGSYSSVSIGYDVRSTGAAVSVDVMIRYGYTADTLSYSATLASGVSTGAGSGVLGSLVSGKTYYARLSVVANGVEGDQTAVFSFVCPMPDSAAGGAGRPITAVEIVGSSAVATIADGIAQPLYAAWGGTYGGETTNGWENVAKVADIAAAATTQAFALPAGWGTTVRFLRFFFALSPADAGVDAFCDHIECLGEQHIDTGIKPDKTLKVRATVSTTDTEHDKPVFGVRQFGFNYLCWFGTLAGGKINPCIGTSGNIADLATGKAAGEKWTLTFGMDGMYVDATEVLPAASLAQYSADTSSSTSLKLFGLSGRMNNSNNGAHVIDSRKFYGECYGFSAYTNGVLVQWLVPCVVNGEAAMYDGVTGAIFRNAGEDSFGYGGAGPGTLYSMSDIVVAQDASLPVIGAVSASEVWRGDGARISGTLTSAGAGDCSIAVETSRTGDFTDSAIWPVDGIYASGDAFTAVIHTNDATSAAYIRPGYTTYFRVRATDRIGALDVSERSSFTTLASLALVSSSAANSGNVATFTVPLATRGANTNYAYVVYGSSAQNMNHSTGMAAIAPDSADTSFVVSGVLDSPGRVYYAVVWSNDCPTAFWSGRTATVSADLLDNIPYVWRKSVPAGIWENAANWEAGANRFDYPTGNATAVFQTATTAEVTIASSRLETGPVDCSAADLDVIFTGTIARYFKAASIDANGARGGICVSNLTMEVSSGGVRIGQGRTYSVRGGATNLIYNNSGIYANRGPDRHVLIDGGSFVYAFKEMCVGGEGSTFVVDDSRVFVPGELNSGFYLGSDASGGTLILRGRCPRIEVGGHFRNAKRYTSEGVVFVIPEGGYDATPICNFRTTKNSVAATDLTEDYPACTFAGDDYSLNEVSPLTLAIDPASPGLSSGVNWTIPLVAWQGVDDYNKNGLWTGGICTNKLDLAALPRRRGHNTYLWSADFNSLDGLSETWTAVGEQLYPRTLALRHEHHATIFMVR